MGFFKDVQMDLRLKTMRARGIYSTNNYSQSCNFCAYWDRNREHCKLHNIGFNGEENRCNQWVQR